MVWLLPLLTVAVEENRGTIYCSFLEWPKMPTGSEVLQILRTGSKHNKLIMCERLSENGTQLLSSVSGQWRRSLCSVTSVTFVSCHLPNAGGWAASTYKEGLAATQACSHGPTLNCMLHAAGATAAKHHSKKCMLPRGNHKQCKWLQLSGTAFWVLEQVVRKVIMYIVFLPPVKCPVKSSGSLFRREARAAAHEKINLLINLVNPNQP